jgi:predicted nucleotidyltransferase
MSRVGVRESERSFLIHTIRSHFPSCEILFFGSRFNGIHRETSDLDLCLRSNESLPLAEWGKLSSSLTESDLPYRVDLCDWHRLKPDFQQVILKSHENW